MSSHKQQIMQTLLPINVVIPIFGRFTGLAYGGRKQWLDSKYVPTRKDIPSIRLLADILASCLNDETEAYGLLKSRVDYVAITSSDDVSRLLRKMLVENHDIPEERTEEPKVNKEEAHILYVMTYRAFVATEDRASLLNPNIISGVNLRDYPKTSERIAAMFKDIRRGNLSVLVLMDEPDEMRNGTVELVDMLSKPCFKKNGEGEVKNAILATAKRALRLSIPRNPKSKLWLAAQEQRDIEFVSEEDSGVIKFKTDHSTLDRKEMVVTRLDLEAVKEEEADEKMSKDKKARLNKIFNCVNDTKNRATASIWAEEAWKLYVSRKHSADTANCKTRFMKEARRMIDKAEATIPEKQPARRIEAFPAKPIYMPYVVQESMFSIN